MAETQRERWYFSKEQIFNTPSRKCGVDYEKEISYRQQAANLIQDMGQRLQVSQLCINTAIVYMHRFYVYHSFTKFHRNQMAACALFLAAKVEEQPRKLEHVIRVAHMCLNRDQPPLDVRSEQYAEQAQELILNENILLQALGFDVAIDHPHTHVVRCCQLVRASKDLAQTSYFMATNSLHLTVMCLQLKPTVVACVCIHLVCKWSNWEIPRSSEGREWFWYVDHTVTLEQLEELTAEFLQIFKSSQSRLKRRIMQHGQGAAAALFPSGSSDTPHKPSNLFPAKGTTRSDEREPRKDGKERMPGLPHGTSRPPASSASSSLPVQHRPSSSSDPQQKGRAPVIDPKAASSSSRPPHHHHHHHHHNKPASQGSAKPPSASAAATALAGTSTSVPTPISTLNKTSSVRSQMDTNVLPKQGIPPAPAPPPPPSSSKAFPGKNVPLFNSNWGGSSDSAKQNNVSTHSGQSVLSAALGFGSQESASDVGFQLNDSGWDLHFGADPPSMSPTSALESMLNAQNVAPQSHPSHSKANPTLPSSSATSSTSSSSTSLPFQSDPHPHVKKEKPTSGMSSSNYGSTASLKSVFDVGDDLGLPTGNSRALAHTQQLQQAKPAPPLVPVAPGRTTEQDIKTILSQALAPPLLLEPTKPWPTGLMEHAQNLMPHSHQPREKLSTKSLFSPPSAHSQPSSVKTHEFSVKEEIRIAESYGTSKRRTTTSMTSTTTIDMSDLGPSPFPLIPAAQPPKPMPTTSLSSSLPSTDVLTAVTAKVISSSPSHKSDKKKKKKEKHKHKEKDKSKDKEAGEEKKHKKHKNKDKEKEKEKDKDSKKKIKEELPPFLTEAPKLKITIPKTKLTGLEASSSTASALATPMAIDTPVKLKIPKQKIMAENGEMAGASSGDLKLKISLGSAASADTRKRHLEASGSHLHGTPSMKMPRLDAPPSLGALNSRSNGAGAQERGKAPSTRPPSSNKVNPSASSRGAWHGSTGH